MKPLIIAGSGGIAREIYVAVKNNAEMAENYRMVGFADNENIGKEVIDGFKIIGNDDDIVRSYDDFALVLGVGFPQLRKKIFDHYSGFPGAEFPNVIHPSVIADFSFIKTGIGNYIGPGAIISPGVEMGNGNAINMKVTVAHDCVIGDFNMINPGADISGNVIVGNGCIVGAGSVIHQNVTINDGSVVGLGAVITRNTVGGATYVGNPAKKFMTEV